MKKIYLSILALGYGILGNAQTNSVTLIAGGGPTTNYASITAAYAAIPASPTANYLIEIKAAYNGTDASEVYPIQLTSKGLLPGGPIITLRPAAGNNNKVIQRPVAASGAVLQINGGDNIIIDGRPGGIASTATNYLTFSDAFVGDNNNRNIELLNDANNNTIQYINATAADANAAGAGSRNILVGSGILTGNNNNIIQNCVVTGGARGIQDFGLSNIVMNTGTIIKNNTVQNFGAIGIFAGSSQTNITIQGNTVSAVNYNVLVTGTTVTVVGIQQQSLAAGSSNILNNTISLAITSSTVTSIIGISDGGVGTENITGNTIATLTAPSVLAITGISAGNASNGVATINVSSNKVMGLSSLAGADIRGMSFFPYLGSTVNVNNNFVSLTQANATATNIFGILFGNTTATAYTSNTYFNTVRIGGANTGTGNSYGILRNDNNATSIYNQKNNLVINDRTGGTPSIGNFGFYNNGNNAATLAIDYNTYYGTAGTAGNAYAGSWASTKYDNTALASYKAAAAPQEANSNFVTASFVSATDLHLTGLSLTDVLLKGIAIAGITTDIDGETRIGGTPTKGADEPTVSVPVTFLHFTGEAKKDYNVLLWSTLTENSNAGFELQKSVDGIDFSRFAFVPSQAVNGNSSTLLNYTSNDLKPFTANSYYRLKQVNKDGSSSYSNIVVIKGRAVTKMEIANLYPNPVTNQCNLVVTVATKAAVAVTVLDASGKAIMQYAYALAAGDNILSINTATIAAGSYILHIKNKATGEVATMKFIK